MPYYKLIQNSSRRFVISNLLFALKNYAGDADSRPYKNYFSKISQIFNENELFTEMRSNDLNNKSIWEDFRRIKEGTFSTLVKKKIIVSLTSFPERIATVHQAIETLLNQSMPPDMVVLWLAEEQFPTKEKELPAELMEQTKRGLKIGWCKDLKSYKKLIPTLKQYPDDIIITADDDLLFSPNMIECLYNDYKQNPQYIHCHRNTMISFVKEDKINIVPGGRSTYPTPTYLHKLCGGAGCLYPPRCLFKDVVNEELFLKLVPTNDDIWFWLMGCLNGFKVNVVQGNMPDLTYIPGTQDGSCLWKVNDRGEKLFFTQLNNVLAFYPGLKRLLINEQEKIQLLVNKADKKSEMPKDQYIEIGKYKTSLKRAAKAENDVKLIRASWAYRIGRKITFIPHEIKVVARYYKANGLKATCIKIINKTKMLFKHSGTESKKATVPKKIVKNYDYYKHLKPKLYPAQLEEWFLRCTKTPLNLRHPETFNEKIQWIKLYDSTAKKTRLSDKYLVREWVATKIGSQYLIPLLGVWDHFDEIDFNALPNQFALKANHGSGWNKVITDKSTIDYQQLKTQFDTWMNTNFAYKASLELHYMNIKPKIIAEEYIQNDNDLYDYKFLCFNGQPQFVWIDVGRYTDHRRNIYNLDWVLQPFTIAYPNTDSIIEPPKKLKEMTRLAKILCAGFAHVRVDFYETKGQIYFGEMTFTSGNGGETFTPADYGRILGNMIKLPLKKRFKPKKTRS